MADLKCYGTNWGPCSGQITHLDEKGYTYCRTHGIERRQSGIHCRQLTAAELKKLEFGEVLTKY